MKRRKFSREFKIEAVKLVRNAEWRKPAATWTFMNVLRKWVKEFGSDPTLAFPDHGHLTNGWPVKWPS